MKTKRKKLRRYEYNFGGFLKKTAPAAVAAGVSAIPGAGPFLAPAAASATNAALNSGTPGVRDPRMRQQVPYSPSSTGYKYGGKMKYANGGQQIPGVTPLGNGAVKYNGPQHEQGGIPIDQSGNPTSPANATAEVEGNETRQGDYIFSDSLTIPGSQMTFAQAHERMVEQGASQKEINQLKMLQERAQEQAGVQGGDEVPNTSASWGEQGYQRLKGGGSIHIKKSKRGTFTKAAKKRGMGVQEFASKVLNNKSKYSTAMVKKANFAKNASKWNKKWGGKYQFGGPVATGAAYASEFTKEFEDPRQSGFDKAMQTAGYVVPSLIRGTMALTDRGVQDSPRVRAGRVPVQSSVFSDTKRKMAGDYRAILNDPNASRNQKLAAQAQLQKGRSKIAGQEADYRGRQQQFNVQSAQRADIANVKSFQQDREIKAQEDAARKKMLTQAIEMPITAYSADKRGKENQIANILVSANRIQNPVDRENTIRNSLRAMGLSKAEIDRIIRNQ